MADRPVSNVQRLAALNRVTGVETEDALLLELLIRNHALLLADAEDEVVTLVTERLANIEETMKTRMALMVERGASRDARSVKQFNERVATIKRIRSDGLRRITTDIEQGARRAARASAANFPQVAKVLAPEVEILTGLNTISADQVRVAASRDFLGMSTRKLIQARDIVGQTSIERELRASFFAGESAPGTARNIQEILSGIGKVSKADRIEARTIARTSVNEASNQAAVDLYQRNTDVIKGMRWVATLDSRVCEECVALDGRIFSVQNPSRTPPAHFSCRCFMSPVVRGLPPAEVPKAGDWIKRQPHDIQDKVLGGKIARLIRDTSSGITPDDIVTKSGRKRSPDELVRLSSRRRGKKAA